MTHLPKQASATLIRPTTSTRRALERRRSRLAKAERIAPKTFAQIKAADDALAEASFGNAHPPYDHNA